MNQDRSFLRKLAPALVRLVALWLLAGAMFKLFQGSPNDLPGATRKMFTLLGAAATFKLAISVESAIGVAALISPRLGWPLLTLVLLVFVGVLVPMALAGEPSCGCFGSKHSLTPLQMIAVDGTLLLAMLAGRPWSSIRAGKRRLWLIAPLAVIGVVAPWIMIEAGTDSAPVAAVSEDGAEPAWNLPETFPRFAILEPENWVGRPIWETGLHKWVNTRELAPDATWIFWRRSCDHCAEHLRELADTFDGSVLYVLIRIPDDADEEPLVDARPPAVFEIDLPEEIQAYVAPTPCELVLEDGVVLSAACEEEEEDG